MIVSFFGHQREGQLKGVAKPAWAQADLLENEYGREGAIQLVRERITQADRPHRRRLYQLHDELARRYEPGRRHG